VQERLVLCSLYWARTRLWAGNIVEGTKKDVLVDESSHAVVSVAKGR
jgi:hypothetical protein